MARVLCLLFLLLLHLNLYDGVIGQGLRSSYDTNYYSFNSKQRNLKEATEKEQVTTNTTTTTTSTSVPPPSKDNSKKKSDILNILTLGGSTTWGARLKQRELAYPHILAKMSNGKYIVTNKAMRATDAHYPSLCIQSMLMDTNDYEFDVIILEFSLNGVSGIDTLVKRLQYRFPNAIFIYVHLYSLANVILDNSGSKNAREYHIQERNSVQWHWDPDPRKTAVAQGIEDFFKKIKGYVYSLPKPKISPHEAMPYFAVDWLHLSEKGHVQVAQDLLDLISRAQFDTSVDVIPDLFDIKWGHGDTCENWFETGQTTVKNDGGSMQPLFTGEAYNQNKFSMEFKFHTNPEQNGGTIVIMNNHATKIPLFITYLSAPHIYPTTDIIVENTVTEINPDREFYHVAVTTQIGFAEPGFNNIRILPHYQSDAPFRLVGVVLYGFHYHRNVPLRSAHNHIPIGDMDVKEEHDESTHHLLTLGGPITWGSNLPNDELSYPARIGLLTKNHVTNMGLRAPDAYYPSICIQSMLGADMIEYDIILLEYSNTNPKQHLTSDTEIRGLRMLVKRLQYRYPNAILIYVHLFSLRHVIKDSHGHLADEHDEPPPDLNWSWAYSHKQIYRPPPDVKNLMTSVGGYVYSLPVPETPKLAFGLFQGPSYDSLSGRGHRIVADSIANILKKAKFDGEKIKHDHENMDGSWGYGDQCLSWLGMGGTIPIEYEGGEKRDLGDFQWSIEFTSNSKKFDEKGGAWIKVVNLKEVATPLFFTYLIGGSTTEGTIVSVNGVITELKYEEGQKYDKFQTTEVGWVGPGSTLVSIEPKPGSILQLIGVAMFGFYQNKELPFKAMHNTIIEDPS